MTTTDDLADTAPHAAGRRPGVLRAGIMRIGAELLQYSRRPDALVFTFFFPVLLYCIFAAAFSSVPNLGAAPDGSGGITYPQYYLPAMIASGVFLTGVQNLAIEIAAERSDGTLKRFGGMPLSPAAYFIGKFGQLFLSGFAQVVLLLLVARFGFGVELPSDPARWLTAAWVFVLGLVCFAVLGVVLGQVPRSAQSATAVVIPVALALQFISGVYLSFAMLPEWLQTIANAFPLAWVAHGMRFAFLPDAAAAIEVGEAWNLPMAAIMLGAWAVAGVVVASMTFRWIRKDA